MSDTYQLDYRVYDAETHAHLPGVPSKALCDTGGKVVHALHVRGEWRRVRELTTAEWLSHDGAQVRGVYCI